VRLRTIGAATYHRLCRRLFRTWCNQRAPCATTWEPSRQGRSSVPYLIAVNFAIIDSLVWFASLAVPSARPLPLRCRRPILGAPNEKGRRSWRHPSTAPPSRAGCRRSGPDRLGMCVRGCAKKRRDVLPPNISLNRLLYRFMLEDLRRQLALNDLAKVGLCQFLIDDFEQQVE
jgi:hypothetical protein